MIRKAFVMSVNPDKHKEYEDRHTPIWPELEAVLKAHGVSNYSIFLHAETNQLFAYAEIENEEKWASIADEEGLPEMVAVYGRHHALESR